MTASQIEDETELEGWFHGETLARVANMLQQEDRISAAAVVSNAGEYIERLQQLIKEKDEALDGFLTWLDRDDPFDRDHVAESREVVRRAREAAAKK